MRLFAVYGTFITTYSSLLAFLAEDIRQDRLDVVFPRFLRILLDGVTVTANSKPTQQQRAAPEQKVMLGAGDSYRATRVAIIVNSNKYTKRTPSRNIFANMSCLAG